MHELVPSGGPVKGGTLVSVRGLGLTTGSDHRCKFGRRVVRAQVVEDGVLVCTSPEQDTASDVSVEVTLNGQQYSRSAVAFAFHEDEEIVALSPSVGPQTGSTRVRVYGSGFQPFDEALCRFGTAEGNATSASPATVRATYVSVAEMHCESPSAAMVGASSTVWLGFANEDELLAVGSVHASGAHDG